MSETTKTVTTTPSPTNLLSTLERCLGSHGVRHSGVEMTFDQIGYESSLTIRTDAPLHVAFTIAEALGGITSRPSIERVITNGPAVVTLFDDGTKQVAKAHEGDRFDPKFGTLWCALRKAARNRAISHLEKAVRKVAQQAKGPDDYEALGNALLMVAQHMRKGE